MRKSRPSLVLSLGFALFPSALFAMEPVLSASLIDREAKALKRSVTVEANVTGLELVDAPSGQPRAGQGHLHYRVDDGLIVATTTTKLSFHELQPGNHRVEVRLVGNDHKPLGPVRTMDVTIPVSASH